MNTSSEQSNVPGRAKHWLLVVAVAVVGLAVAAIALIAALRLASLGTDSHWIPVYQDVLKTSFGALAVGALGGLAKLIFDQRKARETYKTELRDRRYGFISTLVGVRHDVDTATTVIRANQSVKSWTDMVNDRIIPASCRLRDMTHELCNWKDAGLPVFDDTASVTNELKAMSSYLWALLDEYGDKKRDLGELQLKAEKAKQRCQHNREERLNRIWTYMQGLSSLGDLIKSGSDSEARNLRYSAYRENYECALRMMRNSLRPKGTRIRR